MDNVKVCASFILPGSKIPAEYSYSKNGKKKVNKNIEYVQQTVRLKSGKNQVINLIKPIPAKQSIKITKEAYDFWIETPVSGMNTKFWNNMSKTFRVKHHLMEIAKSIGGELDDFEIMKD